MEQANWLRVLSTADCALLSAPQQRECLLCMEVVSCPDEIPRQGVYCILQRSPWCAKAGTNSSRCPLSAGHGLRANHASLGQGGEISIARQQVDDSERLPGGGTWADEAQPDSRLLRSESVLPHEPQRRHDCRPPAPGPAVHGNHPVPVPVAGPKEAAHGVERRGEEALNAGILCPEAGL